MVNLPTIPDLLCVSTTDRVLSVYDASSGDVVKVFRGGLKRGLIKGEREVIYRRRIPRATKQVVRLPGEDESDCSLLANLNKQETVEVTPLEGLTQAPTALAHYCMGDRNSVLVGTDEGSMVLYDIGKEINRTDGCVPCLAKGDIDGERHPGWYPGHTGPITSLRTANSIESIISTGIDGSLRLTSMERGCLLRALGGADENGFEVGHKKAVYNLAWSDQHRTIASCGAERDMIIWNPFITKPLTRLIGSRSPMIDMFFNDNDMQLVSLSVDSTVRVWDIRKWQCVKVLKTKEETLTAIAHDEKKSRIVTASCRLFVRAMAVQSTEYAASYYGHRASVVGVLFSAKKQQIISAEETKVFVWDAVSFSLLVQWSVPVGVTSLSLDANETRLLTGTNEGTILVWNYVSAQLLRTFSCKKCGEVSPLLYAIAEKPYKMHLVVCSLGNKRLLLYSDKDTKSLRDVDMRDYGGVFSLAFVAPFSILLGTRHGIAVLNTDQVAKPTKLTALSEPCVWYGVLNGPLHEGPALACGDGPSVPSEWRSVDSYIECILPLSRLGSIVVASRGDGTVSFWSCPTEQTDGCGEVLKFCASHKIGCAVHVMSLDTAQVTLATGDVNGYVHLYDLSALPVYTSHLLPPAIQHTHIVKTCGFRAFDCNITSVVLASCSGVDRIFCGAVNSEFVMFDTSGVAVNVFGSTAVERARIADCTVAQDCFDTFRRARILDCLTAQGGCASVSTILECLATDELFTADTEKDMMICLEHLGKGTPSPWSISTVLDEFLVTIEHQFTSDTCTVLDTTSGTQQVSLVDHTLVTQLTEHGHTSKSVAAPCAVRVIPTRPLHHIAVEDVRQQFDLETRKPMSARPASEREKSRTRLVSSARRIDAVPEEARRQCTVSEHVAGSMQVAHFPSIADMSCSIDVIAAQREERPAVPSPPQIASQRKTSTAPTRRFKYAYPALPEEGKAPLRKAPITRFRTEAQKRDATRNHCTKGGQFDFGCGEWAPHVVADYDDWLRSCIPDSEPAPLLFWSSEAEVAQMAHRTPQLVTSDMSRRHGAVSRGTESALSSERHTDTPTDRDAMVTRNSERSAASCVESTPCPPESDISDAVSEKERVATPEQQFVITDAQREREWFERAQIEHPPVKRRHRKYDVSSVPSRALMNLTISEPTKVSDPRKLHITKPGSLGVGRDIEAVLDKAAQSSIPVWVLKRPFKSTRKEEKGRPA